MKKTLILLILFLVVGCEQEVKITSPIQLEQESGKQVKWIVSQNYSDRDESIWYVGDYPFQSYTYEHYFQCSKIELFQSSGYFNYVRESLPNYMNTVLLSDQIWSWEEK